MAQEVEHYQQPPAPNAIEPSTAISEIGFFTPPSGLVAQVDSSNQQRDVDASWTPPPRPRPRRLPARHWLTIVNLSTLLTGLMFLYDSHEPGWSALTCASLILFSALAVTWSIASFNWMCNECRSKRDALFGFARIGLAPALAIACAVMVIRAVPAKIGLWASLDEFQVLMRNAPLEPGGKRIDRRVGVYDVRRYAADGRGGVYFVTGEYRDPIGKQNVSIGFAYNPSRDRTPFGREHRLTRISGDWYAFAATDGASH